MFDEFPDFPPDGLVGAVVEKAFTGIGFEFEFHFEFFRDERDDFKAQFFDFRGEIFDEIEAVFSSVEEETDHDGGAGFEVRLNRPKKTEDRFLNMFEGPAHILRQGV